MEGFRRALVVVLLASVVAIPVGSQAGLTDRMQATHAGAAWLASRQKADGTLPTYSGSGVGETLASMLVGGVRGRPIEAALDYIRREGPGAASGPGKSARIVMGLVAASQDPRTHRGTNYVARIHNGYDETTGAYEDNVYADALAALGILAAGDNLPGRAVTYLKTTQCATGGWAWRQACAGLPDVDTTTMVMSALLASGLGKGDDAIARGRTWLMDTQNSDGGFPLEDGGVTNANSTGLALSLIEALDEDPTKDPWRAASGDPVEALIGLQDDTGGLRYKASDPKPGDYATVQAVPGLAGVSYPVAPVSLAVEETSPPADAEATATDAPGVPSSNAPVAERSEHRAGVIVVAPEGHVSRRCVTFDEPSITGEQLLERAGLDVTYSRTTMGAAVCKIGRTGCSSGDCFCSYPTFWGYWTSEDRSREWTFSDTGAAQRTVRDGSVDAWVWAKDGKPAPPRISLGELCAAAAPTRVPARDDEGETTDAAGTLLGFAGIAAALAGAGAFAMWRKRRAA